jgi:hypothetical protein
MTAGAGARLVGGALVAALLGACQVETVVIQRPPIGDQPSAVDRVGEAIVVGRGNGPLGPFRAWTYLTRDGTVCLEIATEVENVAGCNDASEGPIGIGTHELSDGWFVAGSTGKPAETAVVRLADESEVRGPVVPAPRGVTDPASYLVVPVAGARPVSVDLVGADGTVLETIELTP